MDSEARTRPCLPGVKMPKCQVILTQTLSAIEAEKFRKDRMLVLDLDQEPACVETDLLIWPPDLDHLAMA